MPDIEVGGNRSTLETLGNDWETSQAADLTRRPNGGLGRAKKGSYSGNGNASATTFTVTHGLGWTPSRVTLTPKNAASAIGAWAGTYTATTFVINTASAIASGTGNVQYDWVAIK